MKKYVMREVSGNASPRESCALPAANCYAGDDKPRIVNSAKVMSVIGGLLLIFAFLLLLLFVAWMEK